jgi:hypothetical protein
MKKFNGYENWFICCALGSAILKAEEDLEIAAKEDTSANLLFSKGYFISTGSEILSKIDEMTLKSSEKYGKKVIKSLEEEE